MKPARHLVFASVLLAATSLAAQPPDLRDVGPDQSNTDASNPNGASGGRVNGLAADPTDSRVFYAASEWGGLWKSSDRGATWEHLPGHVPTATWDVAVWPNDPRRLFASSFFDGRALSQAGINVSFDGGATWFRPPTSTPPPGFCLVEARRLEPSAFGIAVDPGNPNNVYVGTNCGLAMSTDGGITWAHLDPTPADGADDVWDVVVHDGGIIDLCGDDGHQRSTDGGTTWTTAAGFPRPAGGVCSIDVSPDEPYVVFVVNGVRILESDDGGATWQTYVNPAPQGRIPFAVANDRAGQAFDLWFGDVSLFRAACTTPTPAAPGGTPRCPASNTWVNAQAGAHNDGGDVAFATGAAVDACPVLYSNDGGVYRETQGTSPGCHAPAWEQPTVTPHAHWHWDLDVGDAAGAGAEDVYFGNQDTGLFGSTDGPGDPPSWNNAFCCDGFDVAAEPGRVVASLCCFAGGRATLLFTCNPGMTGCAAFANADYPAGNVLAFTTFDALDNYATASYALITTAGVFVTADVTASPIAWTQLGAATTPAGPCGMQASTDGGGTSFFVKSGGCEGDRAGALWRHDGTGAGGAWQPIQRNGQSRFGVFAVDPVNRNRILAADLAPATPQMVLSTNGGATWQPLPQLDDLMTGSGLFSYVNVRGPRWFTSLAGYPQPSLVAFDAENANVMLAGGVDSGVFLSVDAGVNWQRVTDPVAPGVSGRPHIPRPHHAVFDHEPSGRVSAYVGTKGRGVWRISFDDPGGGAGPVAVTVVPVGWRFDYTDGDHHIDRHSLRLTAENLDTSSLPATLSWDAEVRYDDTNDDDDYSWQVVHGVLNLDDAFTVSGETPNFTDGGGTATRSDSLTSADLVGWGDATVVLKGWSFDFDDSDHHINELGIRLSNVVYDPVAGSISWDVEARFADQNFDDDYTWGYQWQVIATNQGTFRRVERSGSDGGGSDNDSTSETHASLGGYDAAAVLVQGWLFDYDDPDHHIKDSAFKIHNVQYQSSGTVSWSASLTYADVNSDDDYRWNYEVVAFAYNGEPLLVRTEGPFDDDGGADSRSFSQTVP